MHGSNYQSQYGVKKKRFNHKIPYVMNYIRNNTYLVIKSIKHFKKINNHFFMPKPFNIYTIKKTAFAFISLNNPCTFFLKKWIVRVWIISYSKDKYLSRSRISDV